MSLSHLLSSSGYHLMELGVKSKRTPLMNHKEAKEMCICISMSIIEKVFHYEENEISVNKSKGDI